MMEKQELEHLVEDNLKDESFVLVVFNDVGSVMKSVAMGGVIPEQLLALGVELELIGKNGLVQQGNQQAQREQQKKILVPEPNLSL